MYNANHFILIIFFQVNGFSVMNALNLNTKPWICLALNLGIIIGRYMEISNVGSFQDVKLKLNLKGEFYFQNFSNEALLLSK